MIARPTLHVADDSLVNQGPGSSVLATEADEGQAGDWPAQSTQSRSQGVVHAVVDKEDKWQSYFPAGCNGNCVR